MQPPHVLVDFLDGFLDLQHEAYEYLNKAPKEVIQTFKEEFSEPEEDGPALYKVLCQTVIDMEASSKELTTYRNQLFALAAFFNGRSGDGAPSA